MKRSSAEQKRGWTEDLTKADPPCPFRSARCGYYLKGILLIKLLKIYFFLLEPDSNTKLLRLEAALECGKCDCSDSLPL